MTYTTNPYAVWADVQAYYPTIPAAAQTQLTRFLADSQAEIDSTLGYKFQTDGTTQIPATRSYDGNDTDTLLIERVVGVSQILETGFSTVLGAFGQWVQAQNTPTDITADCLLGPDPNTPPYCMLTRISQALFYRGKKNYQVNGVFGVSPVPSEICQATALLAIHKYKLATGGWAQAVVTTNPNQNGAAYPMRNRRGWPEDVCALVDLYKRRNFFTTGR